MTPEERRTYNRAWYAKNRDRIRAYQRAWKAARPEETEKSRVRMKRLRDANPEKYRSYQRKRDGLPDPTRSQPALCECCERRSATHLDHDHKTGAFRGWLCGHCNRGIGQLGDDVHGIMRAMSYLTKFPEEFKR
jgi:hypothetical protein